MDWVQCGSSYSDAGVRLRYRNQAGGLTGQYSEVNECGSSCSWISVLDGETGNVYDWNGINLNGNESWTTGCENVCGYGTTTAREIHMYGDKWVYLNDWIVFGGYGTANPGAISDLGTLGGSGSFPFAEAGIYVYGAIDTSHGNYFANNLYGGKTPYRVTTGDCGNAGLGNYLNFKGNAGQNGNNNCDYCNAYAFAWMYTPGGAGPMWGVGSDDGVRIWQNGTLILDNNAFRGTTWDQDRFLPTGMAAGWNRVLFKVHNGGGGFSGVISLHAGNDFRAMEGSVSLQSDRYGGYSVGYEQDAWYPRIDVASCYGASNPQPNDNVYGNNTTVTASGTASVTGPVPLWKVMHWEWGYNISEGNYADVSSGTTSWSHTQTGVTGHRRFHFFSVSRSGRTSRQTNGASGGDTWADGGAGNYVDVYVDNVAPLYPSFSSVSAASTSQINLGWAIPNDQGVGIAAGSTEDLAEGGDNHYRRGDVGVKVYRGGSTTVYDWGTGTSANDTGLEANTQYTYTIEARDNTSQSRGDWANTTGQQGSTVAWTLSVAPVAGSVTADQSNPARVNWTAVGGFGAGKVQYYRYAFDQSPTHTWTGSEPQWSGGTVATLPTAGGTWYLHVKGYNGANVPNGEYHYAVTAPAAPVITAQPQPQTVCAGSTATFTVGASGSSPAYAWYKHANAGWGSAWSAGGGGGTFVGSSVVNNNGEANCNAFSSSGDINTPGGSALGIVGGGTGEGVTRSFPSALSSGQLLRLDMDNGNVDSGRDVGFTLQNSSGAPLLGLKFTGGGANYKYYDLNSDHDTGIGFTRHGLRVQVLVGSGGTFALFITPCGGSPSGFMGTFANPGDPAKVLFYNNNSSGGDIDKIFFNTIIAGTACDNADNYSGDWNGQDKGDQQISGESGSSYAATTGGDGDQYYALAYNTAGNAASSSASLTLLPLPTAQSISRARGQGASLKIKVSDLTVDSIQSLGTAAYGTVSKTTSYIFYLPYDANDLRSDSFGYTAANTYSCTKQATVQVTVTPSTGQAQTIALVNGKATVHFAGIPGFRYTVQRASEIPPAAPANWTDLMTTNLPTSGPGGDGLFTFEESMALSQAYYRLKYNP